MERKKLAVVVGVLALCSIAAAGARDAQWRKVGEALSKGLPRTAIEALQPIIQDALRARAYPEAIRATAERIALESAVQGNKPEEKIRRLQAEISQAPAPMRPVLEAVLARWYWQYFQANRWRILERSRTAAASGDDFQAWDLPRIYAEIDTHLTRALSATELLQRTPIAAYDALLERGSAPDAYRPTLYDFVANEALAFYNSGEQAGARPEDAFTLSADGPIFGPAEDFANWRAETADSTSPVYRALCLYQALLRFHAADSDPSARLDADLARLVFGRNQATGPEKTARFQAALERLAERYPEQELSARVLAEWARSVRDAGDPGGAWRIAHRGADRFPESVGGRECFNLIREIEAKSLAVVTERVWSAPPPAVAVRYRNLDRIHFRAVPLDFAAWVRQHRRPPEALDRDQLKALLARPAAREWTADLPPTPDFREREERLDSPRGLAPGCYYLLASDSRDFDAAGHPIFFTVVWVSDLALVLRTPAGGGSEGFVLDAVTGAPVPGAEILCWGVNYGPGAWSQDSLLADADGRFRLTSRDRGYILLARHGGQEIGSEPEYDRSWPGPRQPFERTVFFTDRALYRPGQTIRYKGICISVDAERDRYEVKAAARVTVVLRDGNGKEVARQDHRTNDYGSFSGSFTAPRDRLLGEMWLATESGPSGGTTVRVEEYKRPKFAVALATPATAPRLGAEVRVAGKATAYTGAPIDGAGMRWRVVREVVYPSWWRWRSWWEPPSGEGSEEIAHGEGTTDEGGAFTVSFVARPDPSVARESEPTFTFRVHADVTDAAGETRSAELGVSVGYTALSASLSAAEWQVRGRPVVVTVRTATLDGRPQAAAGRLAIYRLRQPPRVVRARVAAGRYGGYAPRGRTGGPAGADPDWSNPATWPEDAVAVDREVATDTSGTAEVTVALEPGAYRARLSTHDRFGNPVTAELPLRVLDPQAARCPLRVPDLLAAPAWTAEPGGTFTALWASGYADARAYVEVEHRGRVLQAYWTAPGAGQVQIRQRVTEAMRGGFTVRVTMVHENRAYLHEERVRVPWSNQELALRWEHFVSKLAPGRRETWTAVVTGPRATRAAAELVATLYDASLDAICPRDWPAGFGVFREEWATRDARFENWAADLRPLVGSWPAERRAVSLTYRVLPDVVLWDWDAKGGALWGANTLSGVTVGASKLIDTKTSASRQSVAAGSLKDLPVEALSSVAALRAGAVAEGGELHFRGGRSGEVKMLMGGDKVVGGGGRGPSPVDLSRVSARRNLEETAFFFPHLRAGTDGEVRLEFTMPEALTEWRFLAFAHDRALRAGLLEARAVTARDLMVQPNPPRFLREGDVLEFTVKVTNRTGRPLAGRVRLSFADAETGTAADVALGNRAPEQAFALPARQSRAFAWRLTVPDGLGPLIYKAVASTGRQSDGEEGALPVLSRSVLVTESLPLPLRGAGAREFDFARLRLADRSSTLRHQSLTVQMVSQPAWYAVLALPYLIECPFECTEQTFNRLYANALARHIATSDPKIRRVFDLWRGTPALDSPLEKNEDLKSVTLEETPWLRQGQAESRARRQVGVLFDQNRLDAETAELTRRLAGLQLSDGAWPWFPGGPANDYITLYITTGFGRLRHLGVAVDAAPAVRALGRLDDWCEDLYRKIRALDAPERNHLSPTLVLYLYGRSFFLSDRALAPGAREAVDYWLAQGRRFWLELPDRQSQAQLALALARFGDPGTARAILRSLKERAVVSEELGMFWRDEERSWWWYRAPIETQAVTIEAFDEVTHDSAAVEDCKVWLLKQKQTQDWKTTKATADAVYALLLRGAGMLASDARVEVALGGTPVRPEAVEAGTGFYEKRFVRGEITPALARITVRKRDPGVAWGSVTWQYLEDMSRITPYAGTPLTLHKALFVRRATPKGPTLAAMAGPVGVGDELVVRLELRVDRDMEYVHLKDYRGSGVEPVDALSGYRFRDGLAYYQETRDAASHFFIDYLPKGTYVFEYSARVQHRGRYQSGAAEIQCMYAPEFNSHSESVAIDAR